MKMTSQHSKLRQITIVPKVQLYTQKCIQQVFKCSMHVSDRNSKYKGDIDQTSTPKNIQTLAPKPLRT